ncbi:hypothetical protein BD626DRAFT_627222 [Schizophyllum amplum]|uniref:Uncharacterized protein n=1 Tax=Schizophyllum amplum TaxID=97359 RepID=A0A550CPM2_9AGAR|nr:hypothetical protein BD626DRAFT_627222 [Auriculariopsis ampla]
MASPSDDELVAVLRRLHAEQPELGVGKIHAHLKKTVPEWSVSSKRIKLVRDAHGMTPGIDHTASGSSSTASGSANTMSNRQKKKEKRDALLFLHQLVQEEARKNGWGSGGPLLPGKSKSQAEINDISRRVAERMRNGSPSLRAMNAAFAAHYAQGHRQEDSWYPLLPEDERAAGEGATAGGATDKDADYAYARLLWIHPSRPRDDDATDYSLVERAKVEAVLGNPAGVYLLYKALVTAAEEGREQIGRSSERTPPSRERVARQLRCEYGVDPLPFEREVEEDTQSEAAVQFMALIMDIAA